MSYITLSSVISVWIFSFVIWGTSFGQDHINQSVSLDLFGELVDIVTPGYLHWSQDSGDSGSIFLEGAAIGHSKPNVTIVFGDAEPVTLEISSGIAVIELGRIIAGREY